MLPADDRGSGRQTTERFLRSGPSAVKTTGTPIRSATAAVNSPGSAGRSARVTALFATIRVNRC